MDPAKQRAMDDEEELLRLQEEMLARRSRPAAKVTRIKKAGASADPAGQQPVEPLPPAPEAKPATVDMAGLLAAMSNIMGSVTERQPSAGDAMPPQAPRHPTGFPEASQGSAAFPAAVHRKQSKFALGRRQQQQQQQQQAAVLASGPGSASAQPLAQPSVTAASAREAASQEPATGGRRVSFAAGTKGGGAAGAAGQEGGEAAGGDAAAIDSENRKLLAEMTLEQIEEAKAEVLSRLRPASLDFLRRRAASKAAETGTASEAASSKAAASASAGPTPPAAAAAAAGGFPAPTAPQHAQQASAARTSSLEAPSSSSSTGEGGSHLPGALQGAGRYAGPRKKTPTAQKGQGEGVKPAQGEKAGSAGSLAGRVRFDVGGEVVGIKPAGPAQSAVPGRGDRPSDVVRRDPIRQDEGVAGEGYTLEEACLLARSSLPQQRAAALRLLGCVLARSRPVAHSMPRPVLLLGQVLGSSAGGLQPAAAAAASTELTPAAAAAAAAAAMPAAALDWVDIWRHALHAADVALVVRLALDDANLAVVGAAAEALVALVGPSEEEAAALEVADANPLTGWPAVPLRHMQRPNGAGGWVAVPARPRQPSEDDGSGGGGEEEEEAMDERQVSKVDPLLGLLHMDLLRRIAYLLGTARAPGAVAPLLCVLIRCCQAGKDVADQVVNCPGMCTALQQILDTPAPGANADAADMACYAARPRALRLLRQLSQASKLAARTLLETGLARHVISDLLGAPGSTAGGLDGSSASPPTSPAAAPAAPARLGLQLEALRAWRAFALHNLYLVHLDDAYPAICRLFAPTAAATALAAPDSSGSASQPAPAAAAALAAATKVPVAAAAEPAPLGIDLQQWAAAREAYLTLAQLCQQAGSCAPHEAMVTVEAATALAREALVWLQSLPLEGLLRHCAQAAQQEQPQQAEGGTEAATTSSGSVQGRAAGSISIHHLSPSPALAALPGVGSSLGAAPAAAAGGTAAAEAYVVLSTLSAALHFLGAFWGARGGLEAEDRAEACAALGKAGLLVQQQQLPGSAASLPAQAAADAALGTGSPPPTACLEPLVQLLQQAVPVVASARRRGPAACSLAAVNLAVALARMEAVLQDPAGITTTTSSSSSSCSGSSPGLDIAASQAVLLLAPLLAPAAAAALLTACSPAAGFDTTMTQPWSGASWQATAQLARAAAAALALASGSGASDSSSSGGSTCGSVAAGCDVAAAVLCALPPGDDSAALLALTELLSEEGGAMGSTHLAAAALEEVASSAQASLAGGALTEQGTPTFPRPALPSAQRLSQLLLAGCAGVWLGLVREPQPAGKRQARRLLPLPAAAVLRPDGSRLPLPSDWPLREVPLPPRGAGIAADPPSAAGAVLLLGLTLEQLGVQSVATSLPGERLKAAVQLAFAAPPAGPEGAAGTADAYLHGSEHQQEELWREPLVRWCLAALMQRYCSSEGGGGAEGGAQPLGTQQGAAGCTGRAGAERQDEGQEQLSMQLQRQRQQQQDGSSGGGGWQVVEAKGLAEQFAAASFGDPLFGAAVATVLRRDVPLDVQLEVLAVLADEHALHLLPPLRTLPGPPSVYLDPPACLATNGANSGAPGLQAPPAAAALGSQHGAGGSSSSGGSSGESGFRKGLDAYVQLVVDGRLDKCLQAAAGGEAPPLPLPLVVHRLAWHIFGGAGNGEAPNSGVPAGGDLARNAALLRLVRACCGRGEGGGGSPRAPLLRMLLRWDCGSCAEGAGAPAPARVDRLLRVLRASGDAGLEQDALRAAGL